MVYSNDDLTQRTFTRRSILRLVAGTALGTTLVTGCMPVTAPSQTATDTTLEQTSSEQTGTMELQKIVANGVELHYIEQGEGTPVVLLHGGLADYRELAPQMPRFSQTNRVIAYSRRYNYPNQNLPIEADYSALVAAEDLFAFLRALDLDQSHIVGYSYGAFTALVLALEHPELVHSLVLAEPPLLRWATGLPGGDALLADFMTSFWEPVGEAFRQGDKELALRISISHFIGADVLDELPDEVRQALEDNLVDWEALTTSSDAFPMISKERVAQMQIPTLSLTAELTTPLQELVNGELDRLLPLAQRVTIQDATHEMWAEQPEACGEAVHQFLMEQETG